MFGNKAPEKKPVKQAVVKPVKRDEDESTAFVLSAQSIVCGVVKTNEPAVVNGTVDGGLTVENSLVLGSGSHVHGPVVAKSLEVNGSIEGNVKCSGHVQLGATSDVRGDVECMSMTIVEGACFLGKVVCRKDVVMPAEESEAETETEE